LSKDCCFRKQLPASKRDCGSALFIALSLTACGTAAAPRSATVIEIARVDSNQKQLLSGPEGKKPGGEFVVKGTFESAIWSGDSLQGGETELDLSEAGGSGRYSFSYDERTIEGTLDDCRLAGDREWTCLWFDEFGTGTFAFRFDAEFRAFEGEWWSEDDPESRHAWNGTLLRWR
jgi:hypothetical protein